MLPFITQRCLTTQAEATRALGTLLGRSARAGDCIACCGSLGAGKTTFVQGFAVGLGISADEYVRSPTFALVNVYHGHTPLYHFDFYRLSCAAEAQDIGFEEYVDAKAVVIVEWADKFPQLLPQGRLEVSIRIVAPEQRCVQWMAYGTAYGRYFLYAG